MTVNTLTMDLGDIKIGIPKTFTFVLTAESYPVVFTKITAGCNSCTVANIEKSAIAALEEIDFKVTFTPGVMGTNEKKVTLSYTENALDLTKVFTFTANVIA